MKLYLKPREVIVALSLTLIASAAFSMEGERKNPSDNVEFENPNAEVMIQRSPLFSAEEWNNMEIGYAILEDRTQSQENIRDLLRSPDTSAELKMQYCQAAGINLNLETIQEGLDDYLDCISRVRNIYIPIKNLAQAVMRAVTQEEKIKHQNDLYYFLSFEKKYFESHIIRNHNNKVPKYWYENNFYDIVSLKICGKSTKPYDVITKYIRFVRIPGMIRTQFDLLKFHEYYESINKKFTHKFNDICPIFMSPDYLIDEDVKRSFDAQILLIRRNLSEYDQEMNKIKHTLFEEIKGVKLPEQAPHNIIPPDSIAASCISLYNELGPLVLKAVQDYEAVSSKIRGIKRDTIEWLTKFKEKNKLYRKIGFDAKDLISTYLQDQKTRELARMREAGRAASMIQPQRISKKGASKISAKKPRPPKAPHPAEPVLIQEGLAQQGAIASMGEENERGPDSAAEIPAPPGTMEPIILSQDAPAVPSEPTVQEFVPPKVKIKTRPALSSPLEASEAAAVMEKAEKSAALPMLPEHLRTVEFRSFIKDLLAEKNDKKMVRSFNELKEYGIFSETDERDNKGYLSIRSPVTGKIHARTYHHLHADNPYGSIFIALRHVLIAADIIER